MLPSVRGSWSNGTFVSGQRYDYSEKAIITTASYRQLGREMPGILQIRNLMRTLPKRLTIENGDLRQTLNPKP